MNTFKHSIIFFSILFTASCFSKMIDIESDSQFQDLINKNQYVVAKFYADWCPPCKMTKVPFENTSMDKEFSHIVFAEVNTEKNQTLAKQYNAKSIPTFIFIKDKKVIETQIGVENITTFQNDLTKKLTTLFAQSIDKTPTETISEKIIIEQEAPKPSEESMWSKITDFFKDLYTKIINFF